MKMHFHSPNANAIGSCYSQSYKNSNTLLNQYESVPVDSNDSFTEKIHS